MDLDNLNKIVSKVENRIGNPLVPDKNEKLHVGIDLGTAYIVLVVLGDDDRPLACEMKFAQVIKDGLVVDFLGAQEIVRELKERVELAMGVSLTHAATAIPPGTMEADMKSHRYVIEGAGMEVTSVKDEPTAANNVLKIQDGAIVDIGGGTTGVSVFKDGKVVHIADEPTGGTHLSLVLSGRYGITFEEAEDFKKDQVNTQEVFLATRPVLEKMATIVKREIDPYDVDTIYLVGGTSMAYGIEDIFENICEKKVIKPKNPLLITPIGIAISDEEVEDE